MRSWRPKAEPHLPPDYDEQVIYAVRAFFQGRASEPQQLIVRDYIMYLTGSTEEFADLSYRPGETGTRASDFAEGKRFVGLMLRKLLRPELTPKDNEEAEGSTPLARRAQARQRRKQNG